MSAALATLQPQITTWLAEGHTPSDILSQIKAQQPELTSHDLHAIEQQLGLHHNETWTSLLQLQQHRQQLLQRLEPRLAAEDAPVSLFNLYRGILRDQEACLWKLLDQKPVLPLTPVAAPMPATTITAIATTPISKAPQKRAGCSFLAALLLLCYVGICSWLMNAALAHALTRPVTPGKVATRVSSPSSSVASIHTSCDAEPAPHRMWNILGCSGSPPASAGRQ